MFLSCNTLHCYRWMQKSWNCRNQSLTSSHWTHVTDPTGPSTVIEGGDCISMKILESLLSKIRPELSLGFLGLVFHDWSRSWTLWSQLAKVKMHKRVELRALGLAWGSSTVCVCDMTHYILADAHLIFEAAMWWTREFPFCTTLSLHDVTTRCTAVSKTVQFPQNVQKSDAVLAVFCDLCFSSRESHDSGVGWVSGLPLRARTAARQQKLK